MAGDRELRWQDEVRADRTIVVGRDPQFGAAAAEGFERGIQDGGNQVGEGWIAPECVEISIWAYCTATSFDDLLARSVAHDGDSDTTAACAGALWGLSGREVPMKYVKNLDAKDAIDCIINSLTD